MENWLNNCAKCTQEAYQLGKNPPCHNCNTNNSHETEITYLER